MALPTRYARAGPVAGAFFGARPGVAGRRPGASSGDASRAQRSGNTGLAHRRQPGAVHGVGGVGRIKDPGEEGDEKVGDQPQNDHRPPGIEDHLFIGKIGIDEALVDVPDHIGGRHQKKTVGCRYDDGIKRTARQNRQFKEK